MSKVRISPGQVAYILTFFCQEFVSKISPQDKYKLLIRLLSQVCGSIGFTKNMLSEGDPAPPGTENVGLWCVCGICRRMRSKEENVCCKKRKVVTSYMYVMFNTICIDHEVLQLAIRVRNDIHADEPHYSTQSYEKAAFWQYTLQKYGKLGRGNLKTLPTRHQMEITWVSVVHRNFKFIIPHCLFVAKKERLLHPTCM